MTKEEALMTIQAIPESFWEKLSDAENEAVEMAVKALKKANVDAESDKPIDSKIKTFILEAQQLCMNSEVVRLCDTAIKNRKKGLGYV